MTVLLERIAETPPAGFSGLEADAKADGHRRMSRLTAEFTNKWAMFHVVDPAVMAAELKAFFEEAVGRAT